MSDEGPADTVEDQRIIVRVRGKLDVVACKAFDARLSAHVEQPQPLMLLDFSGCDYISSAGLRSILIAAKKCKATGKNMVLAGMNDTVREVFRVSGFDRMLVIEPDVEAAIAKHP